MTNLNTELPESFRKNDNYLDRQDYEYHPSNAEETKSVYDQIEEYFGEQRLRWVQLASRNGAIQAISDGFKRILIKQPTGCGKTVTIACIFNSPELIEALQKAQSIKFVDKDNKPRKIIVGFIAHMHRLLTQAERTFAESNNVELRLFTPFGDMEGIEDCDIFIIDEAHHEAMMSVQMKLDQLTEKVLIGLTATDERSDGMVIKFEITIEPCSREQAVKEGWLAETSIWSFLDTTGGKTKVPYIKNILRNYHQIMGGTMIFCRTIAEVRQIEEFILTELGLTAIALTNQTGAKMDEVLEAFSRGEVQFLVNCKKVGEGVDVKGCVSIIIGRNLGSYTDLNQYIGRTARPDSDSQVFELINPLSNTNLDTTVVVGTPKTHKLCTPRKDGTFGEMEFNYVTSRSANDSAFKENRVIRR